MTWPRAFCLIALTIATTAATGCSRSSQQQADAAGFHVTLVADPAGPASDTLRVEIAEENGDPVTDATVSLEGNMTHAGMVPVLSESVWDGADGIEDGVYSVPFEFTMLGDWIITVKIETRDGERVSQDIKATVTNDTVVVKGSAARR